MFPKKNLNKWSRSSVKATLWSVRTSKCHSRLMRFCFHSLWRYMYMTMLTKCLAFWVNASKCYIFCWFFLLWLFVLLLSRRYGFCPENMVFTTESCAPLAAEMWKRFYDVSFLWYTSWYYCRFKLNFQIFCWPYEYRQYLLWTNGHSNLSYWIAVEQKLILLILISNF